MDRIPTKEDTETELLIRMAEKNSETNHGLRYAGIGGRKTPRLVILSYFFGPRTRRRVQLMVRRGKYYLPWVVVIIFSKIIFFSPF